MLGITERLGAVIALGIDHLNDGDGEATVSYMSQRIGNLDDIELAGEALLVTDIIGGRLLSVTPNDASPPPFGQGDAQVLPSGLVRSADFGASHAGEVDAGEREPRWHRARVGGPRAPAARRACLGSPRALRKSGLVSTALSLSLTQRWAGASVASSLGAASGMRTQPATLGSCRSLRAPSKETYVAHALVYPIAMIGKIVLAKWVVLLA